MGTRNVDAVPGCESPFGIDEGELWRVAHGDTGTLGTDEGAMYRALNAASTPADLLGGYNITTDGSGSTESPVKKVIDTGNDVKDGVELFECLTDLLE